MKRAYMIIVSLGIMIIVLSIIQISLSNLLSTGGIQVALMQQELDYYRKENSQLKESLYNESALTTIAHKASNEGFVSQTSTAYILNNLTTPLAIKP